MGWLRIFLFPLSLVYGFGVWVRNLCFDIGLLPSEEFGIPVISVGNLNTGGTGKTPHVEYLVRLLQEQYTIAVLSRGYKRKTKGFLLAKNGHTVLDLGDEPLQMHKKFPDIFVAVHERRRKGIKKLLTDYPQINLIILDDAFQHRYVRAGLNILLTGYYNPFFRNFLLPAGQLREAKHRAKRADALIVTKTPYVFSPLDRRYFLQQLRRYRLQRVFFSRYGYRNMVPLTEDTQPEAPEKIKTIFLLTGIARPEALEEHLKTRCKELFVHRYPDHHAFTEGNMKKLRQHFDKTISHCKIVVTTEKDSMRLRKQELCRHLSGIPVYYLPVRVVFQGKDKKRFDHMVYRFLEQYPLPDQNGRSSSSGGDSGTGGSDGAPEGAGRSPAS